MNSILQCELNENELMSITGGEIGSAELYLVSGLLLCTVSPPVAAALAVVAYINAKAIEHIEY